MDGVTLMEIGVIVGLLAVVPLIAAYQRWGAHLRPSRHPWVWGMGAYLILSTPLDLLWPWHGWSRRLVVTVLFVACVWLTERWAHHLERL